MSGFEAGVRQAAEHGVPTPNDLDPVSGVRDRVVVRLTEEVEVFHCPYAFLQLRQVVIGERVEFQVDSRLALADVPAHAHDGDLFLEIVQSEPVLREHGRLGAARGDAEQLVSPGVQLLDPPDGSGHRFQSLVVGAGLVDQGLHVFVLPERLVAHPEHTMAPARFDRDVDVENLLEQLGFEAVTIDDHPVEVEAESFFSQERLLFVGGCRLKGGRTGRIIGQKRKKINGQKHPAAAGCFLGLYKPNN